MVYRMQKLSILIDEKKDAFGNHPFFYYLKDSSVPLNERLSFLPYISHFVMTFSDINKYVLPFETPMNGLELAVNTHAKEDSNHWPWFINDLTETGNDKNMLLSDLLKKLWSEKLHRSRMLSYSLIQLVVNQPAQLRLVAIEVMEATGNKTFEVLTAITADSDVKLKYCGSLHLSHESGHTIGSQDELIDTLVLTNEELEQANNIINSGFDSFTSFFDELLVNVSSHRYKASFYINA